MLRGTGGVKHHKLIKCLSHDMRLANRVHLLIMMVTSVVCLRIFHFKWERKKSVPKKEKRAFSVNYILESGIRISLFTKLPLHKQLLVNIFIREK